MMERKIVFFIGSMCQGGGERVISILANHFCKDYSVEIVTYYDREDFYLIDPAVKRTKVVANTKSTNLFKNVFWLRKYVKKTDAVFVSFLAPFNIFFLTATLFLKKKTVVADRNDPRNIPRNRFLRMIRNIIYHKANYVVLQTTHNKAYFSKRIQEKSVIIPNPIALNEYAGIAYTSNKKKEIVSVARLMEQKNQLLLIRAFSNVVSKYPEYKLIIYGEGKFRKELEKEISALKLEEKVILPGETKDVFEKIRSAEFFVLSSNFEGMPNALLEAMCLGLPCISTKVSGATDMIAHRENGLLVDVGDLDGLTKSITELIEDDSLRNHISKNAIQLNADFSVNNILGMWLELFNQL